MAKLLIEVAAVAESRSSKGTPYSSIDQLLIPYGIKIVPESNSPIGREFIFSGNEGSFKAALLEFMEDNGYTKVSEDTFPRKDFTMPYYIKKGDLEFAFSFKERMVYLSSRNGRSLSSSKTSK